MTVSVIARGQGQYAEVVLSGTRNSNYNLTYIFIGEMSREEFDKFPGKVIVRPVDNGIGAYWLKRIAGRVTIGTLEPPTDYDYGM